MKQEVLILLHVGVINPVQDSVLVSLVQVVPKKGAITSESRALISQRKVIKDVYR